MGSTNKYFSKGENGLGLDLYYHREPFVSAVDTNKWSNDSQGVQQLQKTATNGLIIASIFRGAEEVVPQYVTKVRSYYVDSNITQTSDDLVNQTSLVDIIEYLQKWKSTYLSYSDFAYLKNLGVYPSNRLIIARRFSVPTPNNIYKINDTPMATLISWVPDNTDFFNIQFGEEWGQTQDGSFVDILDDLGSDLGPFSPTKKGTFGKSLGKGFNFFPLPGMSEYVQIALAKKLGLLGENSDYEPENPPSGNPNLIKEASVRTVPPKGKPGSGLKSAFTIKMTVEYEQKYIHGIDPSYVYLDIIQNALMFGTSKSVNLFGQAVGGEFTQFIKDIISGDYNKVKDSLTQFVTALGNSLKQIAEDFLKKSKATVSTGTNTASTSGANAANNTATPQTGSQSFYPSDEEQQDLLTALGDLAAGSFSTLISKYRIRLFAVIQVMTGAPSGVYHVTIGNPKKPIFSSGDLVCSNISLTLGPNLSYNDLPSSIKLEFTLSPARNLGGQEIMDRFNTGQGRTYFADKRSFVESPFQAEEGNFTKFANNLNETLKENNPGPGGTPIPSTTNLPNVPKPS